MKSLLTVILFLAAWYILSRYLLPRLGIPS